MNTSIQDSLIVGNPSRQELTEQWFDARLSGEHKLAGTIKKYLSTLPPDGVLDFSGKNAHARVAPAASVCASAAFESPRSGNTGGTYDGDITSRINIHRHCDEVLEKTSDLTNITKVDYLSVSFTAATGEFEQGVLYNQIVDFLSDHSIEVDVKDRGLHGYSNSATLVMRSDLGADINCGKFAWSDVQGVFLELSGQGCEFTRAGFADLYRLVVANGGRISRDDVCLDLDNKYCLEKGITVPKLGAMAHRGDFRSIYTRNNVVQSMKNEGDWGDITYGDITPESYDPYKHAPKGLSAYVGSQKSDNQICMYEKGKQLLGDIDDSDYLEYKRLLATGKDRARLVKLMNDNNLDLTYEGEKAWVRVERRFRRGSNKKWLAPEVLLSPDTAFIEHYPGLEKLLADYVEWLGASKVSTISFSKRSADLAKSLLLTRKFHWAKVGYGRLVTTLKSLGMSADEIMNGMARADGLKDYISDLKDAAVTTKAIIGDAAACVPVRCSYSYTWIKENDYE